VRKEESNMTKPVGKPNGTVVKVAAGTSSAASAAISDNVLYIRVVADQNAYIEFGSAPTASATTHYLPANQVEYFKVQTNGTKVAALRAGSTSGNVWISEIV